ncbi:MAG TPA: 3-phosphoglycerate dehydrogenase [Kosmotogaceae bacterium]|nr:MAG: Phosphoglycerate dehydrogenase-like oxidoreductase [Thermotogales bacterium 46_20]HAA84829.1 3-phosphoglycerate dehydrogenase [Kosmotogaceae bacterium]
MFRLHVNDPMASDAMAILEDSGLFEITAEHLEGEELLDRMSEVEFLVVRSATKVTSEVIAAGKKLKVIGRAGAGLDNIDTNAAKAQSVAVYNTPGANSRSVAELTIGLLLALMRHIPRGTSGIKDGKWEKKQLKGNEIMGKTIGIIGYGSVGRQVANMAKALGMRVLFYDPFVTVEEEGLVENLNDLLEASDVVTVHVPKSPDTNNMIDESAMSKMKKGAVLINTARGGIVDEEALYDSLISGKLAGAAMDVFEVEPPTDELRRRLVGLDNVVCTPHIGASTVEAQQRVGLEMARILVDVAKSMI